MPIVQGREGNNEENIAYGGLSNTQVINAECLEFIRGAVGQGSITVASMGRCSCIQTIMTSVSQLVSSTQVRHFVTSLRNEKVRDFDGKL
jgi:hypothetical protein